MGEYGTSEVEGSLVATTSPVQEESRELGDSVEQKKEPRSKVRVPTRRNTGTIWMVVINKGGIRRSSLKDYDLKGLRENIRGLNFLLTNNPSAMGADVMANTLVEEGHLPYTDGDRIQSMLDALWKKSKSLLLYDYDSEIEEKGKEVIKQWEIDDAKVEEQRLKAEDAAMVMDLVSDRTNGNDRYFVDKEGYLCRWKSLRGEDVPQRLGNFTGRIIEERREDNGAEQVLYYTIQIQTNSGFKRTITVPVTSFNSLNWLSELGNQTILEPGQAVKGYVGHYMKVNSTRDLKRIVSYTHTGWRETEKGWAYLTAGGGVGADDCSVSLSKDLERYNIPGTVSNEREALEASISFLSIGNHEVTYPLFALLYLTPLTTLLEPMPNFSGYLYGKSGVFKSTTALLLLSHFGDFSSVRELPNFEDTPNAVEKRAFTLKDALMVLDDYHPSVRKSEAEGKEILADRIIRSYSNRTGRGRLNSDCTEKERYGAKGMLLVTGEEIVSTPSTLARLLVVEILKGDIDIQKMTDLQSKQGLLPHAFSSYLLWIKNQMPTINNTFRSWLDASRRKGCESGLHLKLVDQTAFLLATVSLTLAFFVEKEVLGHDQATKIETEAQDIFIRLAKKEDARVTQEDPTSKFLKTMRALIDGGKVRLDSKNRTGDILGGADGDFIGYYDEDYLYLMSNATWDAIDNYCQEEGTSSRISHQELCRLLKKKGIIFAGAGRFAVKLRVGEKLIWVLKMDRTTLGDL